MCFLPSRLRDWCRATLQEGNFQNFDAPVLPELLDHRDEEPKRPVRARKRRLFAAAPFARTSRARSCRASALLHGARTCAHFAGDREHDLPPGAARRVALVFYWSLDSLSHAGCRSVFEAGAQLRRVTECVSKTTNSRGVYWHMGQRLNLCRRLLSLLQLFPSPRVFAPRRRTRSSLGRIRWLRARLFK